MAKLISIKELKINLGMSDDCIRRWSKLGLFPQSHREGHRVGWKPDEIQKWLDEGKQESIRADMKKNQFGRAKKKSPEPV